MSFRSILLTPLFASSFLDWPDFSPGGVVGRGLVEVAGGVFCCWEGAALVA